MTNFEGIVQSVRTGVSLFESDAHSILARYETAVKSRVVSVDATRQRLTGLTVNQQTLFDEALQAIQYGLNRSAHVSAWAAFMDYLEERLEKDGWNQLMTAYPKWAQWTTMAELKENITEHGLIQAARKIKFIGRQEMNSLHGHLSTRNQCAHPSKYSPGFNEALGFSSFLIDMIEKLDQRSI